MPESFGDVKPQCPILLAAARVSKGRSYGPPTATRDHRDGVGQQQDAQGRNPRSEENVPQASLKPVPAGRGKSLRLQLFLGG